MLQKYTLPYGQSYMELSMESEKVLKVIESNEVTLDKSEEEILDEALAHPIDSARLSELVHPGERVCIIIPDVTRVWQKTNLYLPKIVAELALGGVKDEDILFICALGTHRKQTKEEHDLLLGPELSKRFSVEDHDCYDQANLVYMGKTTFGTPVWVNKKAMSCDHIVLTGGIVYHFLAGWAGGRKYVLPGISSYETVMANHGLSLDQRRGQGTYADVRSGNIEHNPVHLDMMEAASFVKPSFLFNVIMAEHRLAGAVAGNYISAHAKGRAMVDAIDGVAITEQADLTIASAGGSPKDVNLYQAIKTLINAREATKQGGTIIMLAECPEGLGGNAEVQDMILNYDTVLEREDALRADYSISKFVAYYFCETADKYDLILVSSLPTDLLQKAHIKIVSTLDEAMQLIAAKNQPETKVYVMPQAANTLPRLGV